MSMYHWPSHSHILYNLFLSFHWFLDHFLYLDHVLYLYWHHFSPFHRHCLFIFSSHIFSPFHWDLFFSFNRNHLTLLNWDLFNSLLLYILSPFVDDILSDLLRYLLLSLLGNVLCPSLLNIVSPLLRDIFSDCLGHIVYLGFISHLGVVFSYVFNLVQVLGSSFYRHIFHLLHSLVFSPHSIIRHCFSLDFTFSDFIFVSWHPSTHLTSVAHWLLLLLILLLIDNLALVRLHILGRLLDYTGLIGVLLLIDDSGRLHLHWHSLDILVIDQEIVGGWLLIWLLLIYLLLLLVDWERVDDSRASGAILDNHTWTTVAILDYHSWTTVAGILHNHSWATVAVLLHWLTIRNTHFSISFFYLLLYLFVC